MSADTMDRIRGDFATSARHLRAAGFDGVELKASHDGLLRQFLSPLTTTATTNTAAHPRTGCAS